MTHGEETDIIGHDAKRWGLWLVKRSTNFGLFTVEFLTFQLRFGVLLEVGAWREGVVSIMFNRSGFRSRSMLSIKWVRCVVQHPKQGQMVFVVEIAVQRWSSSTWIGLRNGSDHPSEANGANQVVTSRK